MSELDISGIRERLMASRNPVVLTGAGISAESGVPTFRGQDGLWKNFRAEELATPWAFKRDPQLVWEWYDWRRGIISEKSPNSAHRALAELERRLENFAVITQNVDGLHTLAGSKKVLEVHGNIWRLRCLECGKVVENRDVPLGLLPRCACGGLQRPDVVWFGEMLPEDVLEECFRCSDRADFFLVVGTSGIVQPAASFAMRAKGSVAFIVEVNIERTPLSPVADLTLIGRAGEVLPELL